MTTPLPPWVEPEGTKETNVRIKRRGNVCLPLRTVEEDNDALRVPKKGEVACCNGEKCSAREDVLGGPGTCLRALAPSSYCLLCLRKQMYSCYIAHTVLGEPVYDENLVQLWESPVGEGGYNSDCCVHPADTWNGFVSPCVIGRASQYSWNLDDSGWHIDQTRLLHFIEAPTASSVRVGKFFIFV